MAGFENDNQFELSYEFLFLLRWLVDYEPENLKKIITRASRNGFKQEFNKFLASKQQSPELVQRSIVDFFDLLDTLLIEVLHEESVKKVLDRSMIPALDQIDSRQLDAAVVHNSLDKASQRLEHHPEQNPKEVLFKELLKRWKPHKNQLN